MWIIEIAIGLLALVFLNYTLKYLLRSLQHRSLPFSAKWGEKMMLIFYLPFHFILWVVGIFYVLDVLGRHFGLISTSEYLRSFRNAAIICCLTWLVLKWKAEIQKRYVEESRAKRGAVDATMIRIFGRLATITILILTAMIILQIFGLDILPLVAFGGIGAAAIGFAGKDVIANFFGGMMLYITRPFTIGDQILLPDHKLEGTVEEIGWYLTAIRDKEKRPVYLPNSIFSTMLVINCSQMTHRRIEERIGIRYEDFDKVKAIAEEMREALALHPAIDKTLPVVVYLNDFNDYSLDIYIDVYCLQTRYQDYLAIKQEILIKLYEILSARGAEMPYPTRTIITN